MPGETGQMRCRLLTASRVRIFALSGDNASRRARGRRARQAGRRGHASGFRLIPLAGRMAGILVLSPAGVRELSGHVAR